MATPERLRLAHLPTPLWHHPGLDALVGCEVWVKRDDMSAGAAAGNKIRKLEFLLADAVARSSNVLITCGGLQSNHARATALLGRQVGMRSVLLLRTAEPGLALEPVGNVLLDQMVDAEIRLITADQYRQRDALMAEAAADLNHSGERPYVITEGGSSGLGAFGYFEAMREIRAQLDAGDAGGLPFDAVVHACGSGGTAAGVVLGAAAFKVAPRCLAMAVCDHRAYFEGVIARIVDEARRIDPELSRVSLASLEVIDTHKGPGYGVASSAQLTFIREVARSVGLILDPVYSGKGLFALAHLDPKPRRALFVHTGGLPGLMAQGVELTGATNPQ